jgi:hypothetical protein
MGTAWGAYLLSMCINDAAMLCILYVLHTCEYVVALVFDSVTQARQAITCDLFLRCCDLCMSLYSVIAASSSGGFKRQALRAASKFV